MPRTRAFLAEEASTGRSTGPQVPASPGSAGGSVAVKRVKRRSRLVTTSLPGSSSTPSVPGGEVAITARTPCLLHATPAPSGSRRNTGSGRSRFPRSAPGHSVFPSRGPPRLPCGRSSITSPVQMRSARSPSYATENALFSCSKMLSMNWRESAHGQQVAAATVRACRETCRKRFASRSGPRSR